jgi:hypothetical protein
MGMVAGSAKGVAMEAEMGLVTPIVQAMAPWPVSGVETAGVRLLESARVKVTARSAPGLVTEWASRTERPEELQLRRTRCCGIRKSGTHLRPEETRRR